MTIEEILALNDISKIIEKLKEKTIKVPEWSKLIKEYDPKQHPVYDITLYPDVVKKGRVEKVTRVALGFQKLATKRMAELTFGIPVKRVYSPEKDNKKQEEIAKIIEKIFEKNRINSMNFERGKMLYSACEIATLWYGVEEKNSYYGFDSKIKLKCKSYSPFSGDLIYPLFDNNDDLIALSFEYERTEGQEKVKYFDTYTKDKHIQYKNDASASAWIKNINEIITLGKIPAIYLSRKEPIWEDTSDNVYEMEWTLSRGGNYLRKNSKPVLFIKSDKSMTFGNEKPGETESRTIVQGGAGDDAKYITWDGATDATKFHLSELKQSYFTQLQLPDWSFEKMAMKQMSGEAMKQMLIDAHLKVTDESGVLLEFFDREVNVIKAFLKGMMPSGYESDIDALSVESKITPYIISNEKDLVSTIMAATGGNQIMSQREGIEWLGYSNNADATLQQIKDEAAANSVELAI